MRGYSQGVLFYGGRVLLLLIPIALVGALLGVLTLPAGATASSLITVNTTEDELNTDGDCSLREAIEAANTNMMVDDCPAGSPGQDTILLSNTTYDLSLGGGDENNNQQDDFDILDTLIISGTGATISASGNSRIFHIDPINTGVNLTLLDMTLTNGSRFEGGAILVAQGRVHLDNLTLINNQADDGGGGIYARGGAVHMDNSRVVANGAPRYGGGIYIYHGLLEMENGSDVSNNTSLNEGGGIYTYGGGAFIRDSTINDNESLTQSGGGIAVSVGAPGGTVIVNSVLDGNAAGANGGAVYGDKYAGVVITNSLISNNSADNYHYRQHNRRRTQHRWGLLVT